MDIETQMKISNIMTEQAEKLDIALKALKQIKKLQYVNSYDILIGDASKIAADALKEITNYKKHSEKDLAKL